jgi:ribonuclease P protein component
VLPPRIDETEAVPYKPRQLSDIPAETANATRVALVVLVSLPLSTLPRMRGRVERGRSPGLIREEGREADLSTEQACAQAPSWLPNPDGYSGRSQGAQRPSCARAQAAQRLTARPLLCAPHPFGGGQVAVRRLWHVGAMERLKRRKDFLAAAAATSVSTPGFVVQERRRVDGGPARIGFTVSAKVGGAVERNRLRRQLREIVRLSAAAGPDAGSDYVLVGRRAALDIPFAKMTVDFAGALRRLKMKRRAVPSSPPDPPPQPGQGREGGKPR